MKEIGAIFVVSISEIRTVQLAAIKRRYNPHRRIVLKCYYSYDYNWITDFFELFNQVLFFITLVDAR